MVYRFVSLRYPARLTGTRRYPGRSRNRIAVLRHSKMGSLTYSWALDRRDDTDIFRLQYRNGRIARARLLQHFQI